MLIYITLLSAWSEWSYGFTHRCPQLSFSNHSEPFMRSIPVQVCQSAWNAKPHTVNTDPASMRIQSLISMPSCTRSPKTDSTERSRPEWHCWCDGHHSSWKRVHTAGWWSRKQYLSVPIMTASVCWRADELQRFVMLAVLGWRTVVWTRTPLCCLRRYGFWFVLSHQSNCVSAFT